jgi:hypothetical protein
MVERPLSMREVGGSMPSDSILFSFPRQKGKHDAFLSNDLRAPEGQFSFYASLQACNNSFNGIDKVGSTAIFLVLVEDQFPRSYKNKFSLAEKRSRRQEILRWLYECRN